jgi:hypothetical protein
MNSGFKIKKRDDLVPGAIALKFRVSGNWNGAAYVQVTHDIAGTIGGSVIEGVGLPGALYTIASFAGGSPAYVGGGVNSATMQALQNAGRDFAAVTATIDMEGSSSSTARCTIATMSANLDDPSSDSTAIPFWQKIFPEFLSLASPPSFFSGDSLTVKVDNPGNANPSQPNDGTDISANVGSGQTYPYLLVDGQIAPWMLAGNTPGGTGALVVQATINAKFAITETAVVGATSLNTNHKPYVEKTARVTLVSIPGGVYATQTGFVQGEIIPYGLAGYIYAIAQIPQYEGTFNVQEQEITDVCPMGNNLNITGSRAEWQTMNAMVQSVQYDLFTARTTISFGPAGHLGAKDLVERLRTNRFPIRPFYGVGGNMTNAANATGGAQLGNSVAQRGPSPGVEHNDLLTLPSNLSDWAANHAAYTTGGSPVGPPGITYDVRGSGQPNYGGIAGLDAPTEPTLVLQAGEGGSLTNVVRISLSDVGSGDAMSFYLQELPECDVISGTPTMGFRMYLCSAFYTSSRF